MNIALVMFKADGTRRDFALEGERNLIGRTNDCDLRIPLSSVSRRHCELIIDDNTVKLRDLNSSNGTFHNGERLTETAQLQPGDELAIGPVHFTVLIDGKPEKIQPVPVILNGNGKSGPTGTSTASETDDSTEPAPPSSSLSSSDTDSDSSDLEKDASDLAMNALEDSSATASLNSDMIDLDELPDAEGSSSGDIPLAVDEKDRA